MSYSVCYDNRNIQAVAEVIRQEEPDILLLQEVTRSTKTRLEKELTDLYPEGQFHMAYAPRILQAVISRYPLTQIDSQPRAGRLQKTLIETPQGPIAVWNVHTHHPVTKSQWHNQSREFSRLIQDIASVKGPLIVGGDFNTTDQSESYRRVNQYLDNAHWEAGWGFGFTFPTTSPSSSCKDLPLNTPIIRIDHIFYSHHFFAHRARTLTEAGGSDHFPVVAKLSLVQ
jgi:endonuclease/exonuclease/phosphatase (EEP) superfamily protein YafD